MNRYHTEQERIDSMTMQIMNSNIVGSGFVRYPPQQPAPGKVSSHRQAPPSPSYQGGIGGPRAGHQARQQPPMHRGMGGFGPPQVQNLHHFNPSPPAAQHRFHHQGNSHSAGGPVPLGAQGGFAPRMAAEAGGYRPQEMGPPQGGLYQHQMGPGGMGGYRPEGSQPFQNGMGMMGRQLGHGIVPQGMASGMVPRPGFQLPHPMQSMPQGVGLPQSSYMEQGLEQGLQLGYQSRAMENGLVERPQNYQPQAPGYLPVAHAPTANGHLGQQFLDRENGHQQRYAQEPQQQQQPMQHIRVPQLASGPGPLDHDGSRSPAVNYQPPPPHKAPAPIGTPLPGSLATKSSPPKPAPGKPAQGPPVARPAHASRPVQVAPSQPIHRPATLKSPQTAASRPGQPQAAERGALKAKVVEAPVRQAPVAAASTESEEDAGGAGGSLNGDGKEALTKRQKTRLRKKLREQHLKKQSAPSALRSA